MKIHYVYLISNNINDLKYVGRHYGDPSDSYMGSGKLLKLVKTILGESAFVKTILGTYPNRVTAAAAEHEWIQKLNTITPYGYNISLGLLQNEETKIKISVSNLLAKHERLRKQEAEAVYKTPQEWADGVKKLAEFCKKNQ